MTNLRWYDGSAVVRRICGVMTNLLRNNGFVVCVEIQALCLSSAEGLHALKKFALELEELLNAGLGVVEHRQELLACVGFALRSSLGFYKASIFSHDDVHIDFGLRVFFVGQVEEDITVDDADRGSCNQLAQR